MSQKIWYSVYNHAQYPPTSYGIATNEEGIVVTATEKTNWMIGKHIDVIKKFFEGKPADLILITKIKTEEENGTDERPDGTDAS